MAYINQETKKVLQPKIKEICKKYGVSATLAIRDNRVLVLNVKSGVIDFIGNYNSVAGVRYIHDRFQPASDYLDVNRYWYNDHFDGDAKNFLNEVLEAMNHGNYDNSDAQVDYFDVGWYVDVKIGRWNKPYEVQK